MVWNSEVQYVLQFCSSNFLANDLSLLTTILTSRSLTVYFREDKKASSNIFSESGSNISYGSLLDLRMKRMTESRESPQFGWTTTVRDGYRLSVNSGFYNLNQHEELEDARVQNNDPSKIFTKLNSVFSFNGSESSSKTSESSVKGRDSLTHEISQGTNKTPKFLTPDMANRVNRNKRLTLSNNSSPFKNHLPEMAELVKLSKGSTPEVRPIGAVRD